MESQESVNTCQSCLKSMGSVKSLIAHVARAKKCKEKYGSKYDEILEKQKKIRKHENYLKHKDKIAKKCQEKKHSSSEAAREERRLNLNDQRRLRKDTINSRQRKYAESHAEERREKKRLYNKQNAEVIAKKQKAYREKIISTLAERKSQYNNDKIAQTYQEKHSSNESGREERRLNLKERQLRKDTINSRQRKYVESHAEERRDKKRLYNKQNAEVIAKKQKAYREKNTLTLAKKKIQYNKENAKAIAEKQCSREFSMSSSSNGTFITLSLIASILERGNLNIFIKSSLLATSCCSKSVSFNSSGTSSSNNPLQALISGLFPLLKDKLHPLHIQNILSTINVSSNFKDISYFAVPMAFLNASMFSLITLARK